MLSECANPACSEQFRCLHQGKLFCLIPTPKLATTRYGSLEFLYQRFWLCDRCSKEMEVIWDGVQAKVVRLTAGDRAWPRSRGSGSTITKAGRIGSASSRITLTPEASMAVTSLKTEDVAAKTQVFHSILVATDFSEACRRALSSAMALAAHHDAQVSVVHVFGNDRRCAMLDNPPAMAWEKTDCEQLAASIKNFESIGENRCGVREARTGGGGGIVSPP